MAIAIDSSTPALATANTGNAATTAAFVPPAGSVLASFAWHDTAGGNVTNSSSVADTQSDVWAIQATRARPDSGAQNGHVQVSTAVPAASTSMTATSTAINNGGSLAAGMYCAVLTGVDTITPVDAIAEGSSASAVISQLITTVTDGALIMLINSDWNVAATPTPAAGLTQIVGSGLGAGPDLRIWLVRQTVLQTPAGNVTVASAAPTTGNTNNWVAVAFRPAAAGTANPIPPQPARRRAQLAARFLPSEARTVQPPSVQLLLPTDAVQTRRLRGLLRREGRVSSPPWIGAPPATPPLWVPQIKRDRLVVGYIRRGHVTMPPWPALAPVVPFVPLGPARRNTRLVVVPRRGRGADTPLSDTRLPPQLHRDRPVLPALRIRHAARLVLTPAAAPVNPPLVLQTPRHRVRLLAVRRGRWWAPLLEGAEPTDCKVHRPYTGTVSYGGAGTVTRPYAGIVEHCTCCV